MKELKFRAWDKIRRRMVLNPQMDYCECHDGYGFTNMYDEQGRQVEDFELIQYTGLKDKKGTVYIYEGDIINKEGQIVGNKHENRNLLKRKTNLLIEGLHTKTWETTNKKAIKRGCKYA